MAALKRTRSSRPRSRPSTISETSSASSGQPDVENLAYAADFVSFLLHHLSPHHFALVRRVVLFGSSARGDTDRASDVDLLIDTPEPGPLEPEVKKQVSEFERSVKVTRYWQLLGIRPVISVQVERLETWTALHLALLKDGRVLYGPFTDLTPKGGATVALLSWKEVPSMSVRTNLYRTLSGYVSRGQRYAGLLARYRGERIAKGAILIPLSSLDVFKKLFQRLRVAYRVRVLHELT